MATRAASAAPIQRVLRESGIQDSLPLANRNLNSVITTLNPCYSRARKARSSAASPWLETAVVERRASFDGGGISAAERLSVAQTTGRLSQSVTTESGS